MSVYVDDILVIGNNNNIIQQLVTQLNFAFSLKELGNLDHFLGVKVKPITMNSLLLTQGK